MSRRAIPMAAVAVLYASALFAAPVPPPKADDAPSASAVKLLQHRKVQKELKMAADQRLAILDGLADLEEEHEKKIEAAVRMPNVPDDAIDKLDKEHKKGIDKLLSDAAANSLNATQRKRLAQLDWHVQGVAAFKDPKAEKLFQFEDGQKEAVVALAERQKSAADAFFNGVGNDDDAKRKADLFALRKELLTKMDKLLTADQKATWKSLLGEPPIGFVIDDLWLKIEEDADLSEEKG